MADSLPDYYQTLVESGENAGLDGAGDEEETHAAPPPARASSQGASRTYRADAFRLALPGAGWTDRTTYLLTGPTLDGHTHNITITVVDEVEAGTAGGFAARQRSHMCNALDGVDVLAETPMELDGGHPAHRIISVWTPADRPRRYLEQLFVRPGPTGYVLTACFTRSTRRRIGDRVERLMLSFEPRG